MLKWVLGLLLLPSSLGSLWSAARALGGVASAARSTWPFLIGFFGYPVLYAAAVRPARLYVLGHELTHALAAWMSGGSVLKFFVGRKSGHVDVTQSNAAVALAPYVVPIYTALVVASYRLLLWASPLDGAAARRAFLIFLFAMGATLSFHLLHTAQAIWDVRQPDLEHAGGVVFSLAVIALLNGVLLILMLKCLFPGSVAAGRSLETIWRFSARCWGWAFAALASGVRRFARSGAAAPSPGQRH